MSDIYFNKRNWNVKDEYYTPSILVEPIKKYIDSSKVIWCPFDKKESQFVIELSKTNKVIYSHIDDGLDFFEYEPESYDIILSNPPFSKKLAVLERLFKSGKPFGILLPLPILNYQNIGNFFYRNKGLQLLIVDKKVSFDGNTSSFNCSYFCKDLLPSDLIFEHLEHNNSNKLTK